MRLSEYASTRKTRGSYKMPRSVQQSIPIDRIYADGVWQSENVFSLMWQISDINYAMQSDAAKQNILTQLGTVYAGIPADCLMQVCIVSQRMDEKAFARDVLYHRENDGFDALRAERNRQIKANARENGNVVQHKYIIVSTNKPGVKEARERFVQVQGHLLSTFSALECAVTPLDNRARLEVLHKFFRIFEEGRFNFDFDNCAKLGQDFRDSIAPDCIRFCKKHIEIEDFYAKCMTISEYPQQLDDKFISALLQQVPYIVLSIDIEPVETEDAFKEIDNAQMKTDAEKVRFNKKSVENLDFTSSVPQRTQEQDRIIANIRKEMTENDQQMFLLKAQKRQHQQMKLCGGSYCQEYKDYICVDDMGHLVTPDYVTRVFREMLLKNGFRPIRYHDLRHSCASLLIKNKVTMKEVQMWLGHSSFSTTANIYAHIDVDSKMEAANMIASKINLGELPEKKKSPKRKIA